MTTTMSLIINTACLDPFVAPLKSLYAHTPYAGRAAMLREHIIPNALAEGWDEIIVVGTFEAGRGYRYVPMQPIYRDRRDALWQRELGARHSTGAIVAFCHDDHTFAAGTVATLRDLSTSPWDILVPERIDEAGTLLDNGATLGYMGGHALVMRRDLWAKVPWTTVDTEWWDVSMTRVWREEGAKILWTNELQHIDLDAVAKVPALMT